MIYTCQIKEKVFIFLTMAYLILPGTVGAADSIRVATINVWAGLDYKGKLKMGEYQDEETHDLRTQVLIDQLIDLAPDVIAVNEANKLPRYARFLARQLDYDQVNHVGIGGIRIGPIGLPVNLREGDVILADKSLNLRWRGRKQLSGGPVGRLFTFHFADATQIICGRIRVAGSDVYVFNTHWHASPFPTDEYLRRLKSRLDNGIIDDQQYKMLLAESVDGQEWRLGEAEKTVAFIGKIAGSHPVILLGDFNATSETKEIEVLKKAGFQDAYAGAGSNSGYTWNGERNENIKLQKEMYPDDFWLEPTMKRIDYVFFRGPGLTLISSEVVLNQPVNGVYPSDHFGVTAVFNVEPSTP